MPIYILLISPVWSRNSITTVLVLQYCNISCKLFSIFSCLSCWYFSHVLNTIICCTVNGVLHSSHCGWFSLFNKYSSKYKFCTYVLFSILLSNRVFFRGKSSRLCFVFDRIYLVLYYHEICYLFLLDPQLKVCLIFALRSSFQKIKLIMFGDRIICQSSAVLFPLILLCRPSNG